MRRMPLSAVRWRELSRKSLRHRAGGPELPDRSLVVAGIAQDLVRMLADAGRLARWYLPGAVDEDRAVDRQHGVVLERHQHFVLDHLPVVRHVVEDADHAEYQAVAVENPAPFGKIPAGKDLVEHLDE